MLEEKKWLEEFLKAPLSDEEKRDIDAGVEAMLKDGSFSGTPSFGTGGMRQVTGLGSNRLNRFTIAKLNIALSKSIKKGTIVIGYGL